jgi:multiple antibiotic resistance protein
MDNLFQSFLLSFIPIFVAVDAIGNVPIFVSLVEGVRGEKRRKIIRDAVTTATAMSIIFMIAGKYILRLLGITISDFQVAGGAFLFIIAVRLLFPGAEKKFNLTGGDKDMGVFPLGTPLITGPAVLTTTLMMVDRYNITVTLVSVILNMLIVWYSLIKAEAIMNIIGPSGTRAFSKIMYILLGAIGVMMIRHGVEAMLIH